MAKFNPDQALAELRDVGAPYATAQFPLTLAVLDWPVMQELSASCQALFDGLDALLRDICAGDLRRLAALCRVPEHEIDLVAGRLVQDWGTVARPDVVIHGGRAMIVEPNCDSPAGLFSLHDMLYRVQRPLVGAGVQPRVATPALAERLRAELAVPDGVVAICYWRKEAARKRPHWYYGALALELARYGIKAVACPVEDLAWEPEAVMIAGDRVGAVYRFFESPEQDEQAERALLAELIDRVVVGQVGLLTGYQGEVFASKICLALLSDETYTSRMAPELAGRLARHVPWTRVIEPGHTRVHGELVDLLPWIRANRELLVLKPVRGHGGIGVVIGQEATQGEWEKAVAEAAGAQPWLAQELVAPERVGFSMYADRDGGCVETGTAPAIYGVFMVDRRPVAVLRRLGVSSADSLNINARSGFVPQPVWWTGAPDEPVDERALSAVLPPGPARPR